MNEPVVLVLRGLAGGIFVVVFALLGSVTKPKRFAGLFSAAPSVAIASLLIVAYSVGTSKAKLDASSMVIGAVAMIVAAMMGLPLLRRLSALRATFFISGIWLAIAAIGYAIFR